MNGKKEGFVKREYGQGLARSEVVEDLKAEEINLARKIENRMKHLMQILNSIGGLTYDLNKSLLPPIPKAESGSTADQRAPQGWLEYHLADLDNAICRAGQIYSEVTRLVQATKIEKQL
ncbi:hypothetical protein ES705_24657 [subsurface metagenome]